MSEIKREEIVFHCRGCNRDFDETDDVCQLPACGFCRRCHVTAYGQPQPHAFNDPELLRG